MQAIFSSPTDRANPQLFAVLTSQVIGAVLVPGSLTCSR